MRICCIMTLLWRRLQPYLLVLMAVIPTITSRFDCPADVKYETNRCLASYYTHRNSLGDQNFYSGIDVESIRFVCTELSKSIKCVIELRNSCPETSQSHITTAVEGPLVNLAELCHVENIYELYSRHQNCYAEISKQTSACANEFENQIEEFKDRLPAGDASAQREYCRHFERLTSCMNENIAARCGAEAAKMTETLVRASFGQSEPCETEPHTTTTLTPTTLVEVSRTSGSGGGGTGGKRREQHGGAPVGDAASTSRLSPFTAAALILASAFIVNSLLPLR